MIDPKIQEAIKSSIEIFAEKNELNTKAIQDDLIKVFSSDEDFLSKVDLLDAVFDDYPQMEALREVFFDLLLMNFFSADVIKLEDDYLDSPEWEQIEEDTLDRGTELLNVLLYLNECKDEDIEPELEDFLKEFLLVDEDEFQDEHRIYEDIIANQILMETSIGEIASAAANVDDESELKDLFYPIMCFFYDVEPSEEIRAEVERNSVAKDFDMAVFSILENFNQN
ncbi:hypothetical protein [Mucilaginibacter paludis]|uniref:Uncharacterized protein n=1 Tax=Mucilaginibacter paludis DSM 18603 TaxID=714943 RepID=H1Y967_9SPHI|nr:hypothetical protein [Mucilaginibacter paludis]EHQ29445.1 hypothetical protein Mucpa_5371 [Mucilaginibacter paludis DSM 18603]